MKKNLGLLSSDTKSIDFILNNNLIDHFNLYSVASRNIHDSRIIAKNLNFQKFFGSYEELIEDNNVEFILNFLPSSIKFEYTYISLKLNKKVIVDYPIINSKKDLIHLNEVLKSHISKNIFLIDDLNYKSLNSFDNNFLFYCKYPLKQISNITSTTVDLLNDKSPDLFYFINLHSDKKIKIQINYKKIDKLYGKLLFLNSTIFIEDIILINLVIDNVNSYKSNHFFNSVPLNYFNNVKNSKKNPFNYDDFINFVYDNKTFVNDTFFQYYPFKLFNEVINE